MTTKETAAQLTPCLEPYLSIVCVAAEPGGGGS